MTDAAPPPVPVKPEDIPADLICAICMGLPEQPPVLTPCQHLFCRPCLTQALERSACCPVDRSPLRKRDMKPIREGTVLHRIWGGIPVKCGRCDKGCAWTGGVSDYAVHLKSQCTKASGASTEEIEKLRRENESLNDQVNTLKDMLLDLETDMGELQDDLETAEGGNFRMSELLQLAVIREQNVASELWASEEKRASMEQELEGYRGRPDVDILFNGTYHYPKERVVHLSRLIARYLENKPKKIDANRIYSCVEQCYRNLEREWSDNRPKYYDDMRMLLATCAASTWFTANQSYRIECWMSDESWLG